jgi:RHS repeat-associated protein
LSGTLSDPFGYKGKVGYYTDTESGLQLLTYRYYDPNAGRFITRDPISYVGGINIYAYINNNPIGKIDVLGLDDADRQFEESGNEPKPAYDPWYWSHNESADNTWPERAGTPGRIPYIPYVNISFTPPVTPGVGGGIIVTRTGIYPQITFLNSPGLSVSVPLYPFAEEPTTGWSTGFSGCYGGCFSVTGCESGLQTEIGLGTPGGGAPQTYVFGKIYKW